MTKALAKQIRELHLKLAEERGMDKTYCPSEVARKLGLSNWQNQMENVRVVADDLVKEEILEVLQKESILAESPSQIKGPIRLRLKRP